MTAKPVITTTTNPHHLLPFLNYQQFYNALLSAVFTLDTKKMLK